MSEGGEEVVVGVGREEGGAQGGEHKEVRGRYRGGVSEGARGGEEQRGRGGDQKQTKAGGGGGERGKEVSGEARGGGLSEGAG